MRKPIRSTWTLHETEEVEIEEPDELEKELSVFMDEVVLEEEDLPEEDLKEAYGIFVIPRRGRRHTTTSTPRLRICWCWPRPAAPGARCRI